eukprot:TRINITY_DN8697_c0_g1_i1.p2 TRINITY_DN8697_c0_g1~~TRINITY_DN8697_c0_g1_i1.p2  ORF type:complete len:145 (-),score=12.30 TRINITY_DN8697_c0_g1_i1:166-600(-)
MLVPLLWVCVGCLRDESEKFIEKEDKETFDINFLYLIRFASVEYIREVQRAKRKGVTVTSCKGNVDGVKLRCRFSDKTALSISGGLKETQVRRERPGVSKIGTASDFILVGKECKAFFCSSTHVNASIHLFLSSKISLQNLSSV